MTMSVCLSICPSPMAHMRGLYENYQTNQRENLGQCWDDESRLPDAVL